VSKLFDLLDQFKYGLLAALTAYIVIFMYLQMNSYTVYVPIVAFNDGSYVDVPDDEIHLSSENIEMNSNFNNSEVRNIAADVNDDRKESDDWRYQTTEQVEQSIKDLEKEYEKEAGGEKARAAIMEKIKEQKAKRDAQQDSGKSDPDDGGGNAPKGNTMIKWDLKNRNPHQNKIYHVRNPGYTCGFVNGRVKIMIKVNQSGRVTSAVLDPLGTSGANSCMVQQAKEYALKSRFNYSSSASKSQSGYIEYIFVSQ